MILLYVSQTRNQTISINHFMITSANSDLRIRSLRYSFVVVRSWIVHNSGWITSCLNILYHCNYFYWCDGGGGRSSNKLTHQDFVVVAVVVAVVMVE